MPLIGLTSHIIEKPEPWKGKQVFGCWNIETEWIARAGGTSVMLPPNLMESDASLIAGRLDGLLLVGGGDVAAEFYGSNQSTHLERVYPERDRAEIALIKQSIKNGIAILAICRGVQILNVALGGSLITHIPDEVPDSSLTHRPQEGRKNIHDVTIEDGSKLLDIFEKKELQVNSYHHQAIKELGEGLKVSASAADGIIEAVELAGYPFCIGVQWHPEVHEGNREDMQPLYNAFVNSVK